MNNKGKNTQIRGIHIYQDSKGRMVYWDSRKKQGLYIPPVKYEDYRRCSMRAPIALVIAAFLIYYQYPLVGIIAGILIYLTGTYLFHHYFLKELSVDKDFDPSMAHGFTAQIESGSSTAKLFTASAASVILAVLFITGIHNHSYPESYIWIYWIVTAVFLIIAVFLAGCGIHKMAVENK